MATNACWGIEVGFGALKAVKLERSGDSVVCTDFAIIPHKRVLSTPDSDEKDSKRVALGMLVAQRDLDKASVAISVPGHSTFARFAKLPPVEPKKIPDIVKFEAVQQIPFPIDEVEWDYQTFTSPDSPDVEVGIFAMTRERVMEKLTKWQDVGHTPDHLTLSPLAAYNAIAYDQSFSTQTPGTVILDVGTTSSDLIVAHGGRMWIRTFPIGGHQFTEALATAFNLSYTKAEKLKKEAESTQYTRQVLQAMRPVFGDLAQDVQRSIGYYQTAHREAKLTRLIGLGSTFELPGLKKFLSQQLQLEVGRLESFNRIKYEGPGGEEKAKEFAAAAPLLATAIGCALQGLGEATINANLMPVAMVREAMWTKKSRWFVAAAALAVAAGGVAFIRPVIDSAALASAPRPAESIDGTKRLAKSLVSAWNAELSTAKLDFTSSNSQLLLAGRDVYAEMANDLLALIRDEAEKAAAKQSAGEPVAVGAAKFERVIPVQWRNSYELYSNSNESEKPGTVVPVEGEIKPHIRSQLELMIVLDKTPATAVVDSVLKAWAAKQNALSNRPYTIVLDAKTESYQFKSVMGIDEEAKKDGAGGASTPPPLVVGGPKPPPPGPRPRPGNRTPTRDPQGPSADPANLDPQTSFDQRNPTGAPSTPGKLSYGDLDKLASLGKAPELGPAGSKVSTFLITWDAVFKMPTGDKLADGTAPPPAGTTPPGKPKTGGGN